MTTVPQSDVTAFVAAARQVAAHGLVRCSSGNLSRRIDDEHMLVTTTGAWMADLTEEQVAVCRIADGEPVEGGRPSIEAGMHARILLGRADVGAALHFQSPFATVMACRDPNDVDFYVIPEMAYFIGPVASVPYLTPGSEELAEAVAAAVEGHDIVILRNHGQFAVGKDLKDTIQKATFFELACSVLVRGGQGVQALPEEGVARLRAAARSARGA